MFVTLAVLLVSNEYLSSSDTLLHKHGKRMFVKLIEIYKLDASKLKKERNTRYVPS